MFFCFMFLVFDHGLYFASNWTKMWAKDKPETLLFLSLPWHSIACSRHMNVSYERQLPLVTIYKGY